jgi:CheY-like chemotaxis protein
MLVRGGQEDAVTHRILIVDDDAAARDTYALALQHEGYELSLADSVEGAIDMLSIDGPLHGQFLDLRLADRSGLEVLRWMRQHGRFIPTCVMTAFRFDFNPDSALEMGALAFVDQPMWLEKLISLASSLTRPLSKLDNPDELHQRVIAGDPGALECLCAIFLETVPARLERAFPKVPSDLVCDAVSDSCLEYGLAPRRCDARRGRSVVDFAYAISWRNLENIRKSELARKNREHQWAMTRPVFETPDFDIEHRTFDLRSAICDLVHDERERNAAEAWLEGGTSMDIANALCGGPTDPAVARQVKQFKDRLIKRLSRHVRRNNLSC